MRSIILLFLFFGCSFAFVKAESVVASISDSERIFAFDYRTSQREIKLNKGEKDQKRTASTNITFVVRMPKSWNPKLDKEARASNRPSTRGIIAFCAHDTKEKMIEEITKKAGYQYLIELADRYNLAVVTWSYIGGYDNEKSYYELERNDFLRISRRMDIIANEWEKGYRRTLSLFNLPKKDAMIYGVSAGAQVVHRIVMRKPQYFSGVFIHVNSSYDMPTKEASKVLWCISTGEFEYGYIAAEHFYKKLLDLDYCVLFKAFENIGHEITDDVKNFCSSFFEYLITFIPDTTNPNWKKPPIDKFYLVRYPTYIGDYQNQVAYPSELAKSKIPNRKYMVSLPTKQIAEAWGEVIEK